MKLYATVTSERASKGQGGNDYLTIDLTVGNAKEPIRIGQIDLRFTPNLEDHGIDLQQWTLQYRKDVASPWGVIASGDIAPDDSHTLRVESENEKGKK